MGNGRLIARNRGWVTAAALCCATLLLALLPVLRIHSNSRAGQLSERRKHSREAFIGRWSQRVWRRGEDCNALSADGLAPTCARAFAFARLTRSDPDVFDEVEFHRATAARLKRAGRWGKPCLDAWLEAWYLAEVAQVGGGFPRMLMVDLASREAYDFGRYCLVNATKAELQEAAAEIADICSKPTYIAGAYEWQFLDAAAAMETLYVRRPFIPVFWRSGEYATTSAGTILDAWGSYLDYAARAAELSNQTYPRVATRLSELNADVLRSQAHMAPFGVGWLRRRDLVEFDRERVAMRRSLACQALKLARGNDTPCPDACGDPYSGLALKWKLDDQVLHVYSVGKNLRDDAGVKDDLVVSFDLSPPPAGAQ